MRIQQFVLLAMLVGRTATAMICDEEIRRFQATKEATIGGERCGGQFLPREFRDLPWRQTSETRRQLSVSDHFAEALCNSVIRTMSSDARVPTTAVSRNISWRISGKNYAIGYDATVADGAIVREICAIKFSGMPELRTVNGRLDGRVNLSVRQMCRMLLRLESDGINIAEIMLTINRHDTKQGEALYNALIDLGYPTIKTISKGGTQILFRVDVPENRMPFSGISCGARDVIRSRSGQDKSGDQ